MTVDLEALRGQLTERQFLCAELAAHGLPNKVISHKLNFCEAVVKNDLKIVFRKLGIAKRSQLPSIFVKMREAHPLVKEDSLIQKYEQDAAVRGAYFNGLRPTSYLYRAIEMLALGMSDAQIAAVIGLSADATTNMIHHALPPARCMNRTMLVRYWILWRTMKTGEGA